MSHSPPAAPARKVLAGTGHRPDKLGGYGAGVSARLVDLARAALVKHQPDEVISGMALGWDTALALAAIELGIPLTAAVPFEGQERKWRPEQQEQFRAILALATTVAIVSPGGYAVWKMQTRNEWMIDRATGVLALWNGSGGGTGNCIEYARTRQVEIVNLWGAWERYAFTPQQACAEAEEDHPWKARQT
ncbi:SLOG family protein [Massilia jejuensis]|uniref:SLOG family protein n=1 Tax=Massilia jejuensis TaxID=648894 RepID=A0ABW0PHW3_9BURK